MFGMVRNINITHSNDNAHMIMQQVTKTTTTNSKHDEIGLGCVPPLNSRTNKNKMP